MGLVSRVIRQFPNSMSEFEIAASFTFSDKAAWNNEINELFPTIAYELASTIPGILDEYRSSMDKETSRKLMNASLRSQFWNFVIKPMLKVSAAGHIRTVIINGIDRAGYQNAREILTIIAEALDVFRLPLRFIISSNRDTRIQDTFNLPLLSKISRQFFVGIQPSEYLTRAKNSSPTDIFGLQRLLTRHSNSSLSRSKQPANAEVVETLTERSRRNAVYANTVMNFLNTTGETSRAFNEKLKLVLEPTPPISRQQELTGTASFTDLDALFNRILSTHPNSDTLVHALGILLVLHDCAQPQTILHNLFGMSTESFDSVFKVLESLMNFPKLENEQNIHPWRAVKKKLPNKEQRVNSPFLVLALLSLSTTMPTAFTIPLAFRDRVHDAFYDFLVNPERSGRFHIDIPYFHGLMTLTGFRCVVHCMWRPSRHDLRRTGDLSADTWDYLKFHLQDHYAQCSSGVREQVLDEMQHTLKVIARTFGDKSEPSSDARSNVADFFDKVAILIDMMVDDWDAFGEWSHSADKHRYKDFRQAMNSIRDDLFPRRNTLLLRKLSGKLGLDGHGHRERTEGTASVSPNLGTAKGPTAIS
ncbi:hypothetical protein CVT26_011965 [Gymnopilus dilepis]|uniref:Nephrocystin 3-like N-terminal domain-containing protein n=1 Tax=Gymnopilus dilepis TaxID=231916 RepID=A0A409VYL4_9AGAR|nr:hypothetical protein CVT26_011965 [Gymnopilus dilepis]